MTSVATDPSWKELVKSVGPLSYLQPCLLFSRSFGCEARPGALTGKISVGAGGSLLLSAVEAKHTFLL